MKLKRKKVTKFKNSGILLGVLLLLLLVAILDMVYSWQGLAELRSSQHQRQVILVRIG